MRTAVRLPSHKLTLLLKILEASEGLAILKTIDGKAGRACLIYPECNQQQVQQFIEIFALKHNLIIDE